MNMSGAKPSQPPVPIVCNASKCVMLIKAVLIKPDPSKIDQDYARRRFLALCNLPQDFSLPQAGDASASGMNRGNRLWFRLRLLPWEKLDFIPKRNRMTHR